MLDGKHLEESMPTGSREACVICFDITKSSQIESESSKDRFCGSIMIDIKKTLRLAMPFVLRKWATAFFVPWASRSKVPVKIFLKVVWNWRIGLSMP